MARLRDEAEAVASALETEAVGVDDAIAWADAQILVQDRPHWALCEVATSRAKYPQDLAAELRQLPGQPEERVVRGLLVILLARMLTGNDLRGHQVASALYQLAYAHEIDDAELDSVAWWAVDALMESADGILADSPSDVVALMRVALERAQAAAEGDGVAWGCWPRA